MEGSTTLIDTGNSVMSVLRGHFWHKEKCFLKTDDILKEILMNLPANSLLTIINDRNWQLNIFWSLEKQILLLLPVNYDIFQFSTVRFSRVEKYLKPMVEGQSINTLYVVKCMEIKIR